MTSLVPLRTLWRLDDSAVSKRVALRDAAAVVAAMAAGSAYGGPVVAVLVGTGALNAAMADGPVAVRVRLVQLSIATLVCALAAFTGALTADVLWLAIPAAGAWSFAGALAIALGPEATTVGITSISVFIVLGREPLDLSHAAQVGWAMVVGGAFAVVFAALAVPSRTSPQRRAVAAAFDALAKDPMPGDALGIARASLQAFGTAHGTGDESLRTLLDQASALREDALLLGAWRDDDVFATGPARPAIGTGLAAIGDACRELACGLRDDREPLDAAGLASGVEAARDLLADACVSGPAAPLAKAAAALLAGAASQLRSAAAAAIDVRARGGRLRDLGGALRLPVPHVRAALLTVRANLSPESPALRHALRLSACVMAAEAIVHVAKFPRGYWMPMTAALVLKPEFAETLARGVLRVGGTLLGIALATALDHALGSSTAGRIAVVAAGVFVVRGFGKRNYGLLTLAITVVVVELLSLAGVPVDETIGERLLGTLGGGALALAFYLAWPTSQRRSLPKTLAELVDADRAFWAASLARASGGPDAPDDAAFAALRVAARLARSSAEASLAKLRAEPGARGYDAYATVWSSAHRFALTGLRIAALGRGALEAPTALTSFAAGVDATLAAVAARLRGESLPKALPDLDAARRELATQARGDAARLLAIEADAAANGLDTMVRALRELER